jgi:hypothetical protein
VLKNQHIFRKYTKKVLTSTIRLCYDQGVDINTNILSAFQNKPERSKNMTRSRNRVHNPYFRVRAHQMLLELSDAEMAKILGCSIRTYLDKVLGWSDFKPLEARTLSDLFGQPQDYLFFTRDVPKSTQ